MPTLNWKQLAGYSVLPLLSFHSHNLFSALTCAELGLTKTGEPLPKPDEMIRPIFPKLNVE
jgi:hypothetical protein